ncbi:MAG: 3'(2'),5'-bisphosphate nucleotidase CysQ family protein, partial [Geminicoccaceae bacterium]
MTSAPLDLLPKLTALAERAGALILEHYRDEVAVRAKADASPVTAADEAAEALILEGLRELAPDLPAVAEEMVAGGRVPTLDHRPFWLVDPLDGTKEFLSKNGEFTVNIALIEGAVPVLGVVLAPAKGLLWWGVQGHGAYARVAGASRQIQARPRPAAGLVAVASRSHADAETEAWLDQAGATERISAGSSLKFCLIA